jgi:hypothetical protein
MSPVRRASTVASLRNAVGAPADGTVSNGSSPPVPQPVAVPVPPPLQPEKRVRFTLDLEREQHRFLKRFALDAEVDAARVMRALLDQLRTDTDLANRVRGDAWQERGP